MTIADYFWQPQEIREEDVVFDEPLGTKEKGWISDKAGEKWLLKLARINQERVLGEDWAEWIASRLGPLFGIPCAEVEPAYFVGRRAILSKSIVRIEASERLVHGNSLLAEQDPRYNPMISRKNSGYTLQAVQKVLRGVGVPQSWKGVELDAMGVWAGYLVFDALIAGRDRHHENWGIITQRGVSRLAESFDHGNALGFQESPERHEALLNDDLRQVWLAKGKSHHFVGKPTLVEVAREALILAGRDAYEYWLEKTTSLNLSEVERIISHVPSHLMPEETRSFVNRLLQDNQRRVVHALSNF